jgi:hypothetical protein
MTTTLDSAITAELGWTWRDHVDEAPIVDSNHLQFNLNLPDGDQSGQANAVWHAENQSLGAGDSRILELDLLEESLFGDLITIPMAKVKALLIVNKNSAGSGYLLVGGAAEHPWYAPFGAPGDTVKVMPGSPLLLTCPGEGWEVGLESHALRLVAVGASVSFDVAILGTTESTTSS